MGWLSAQCKIDILGKHRVVKLFILAGIFVHAGSSVNMCHHDVSGDITVIQFYCLFIGQSSKLYIAPFAAGPQQDIPEWKRLRERHLPNHQHCFLEVSCATEEINHASVMIYDGYNAIF